MSEGIWTVIGTCIGVLGTGIVSIVLAIMNNKKEKEILERTLLNEKQKTEAINLCDQIKSFYDLELLYIDEIIRLQKIAKDKEFTVDGVRNKFREILYKDGKTRIEFNSSSAEAEKLTFK